MIYIMNYPLGSIAKREDTKQYFVEYLLVQKDYKNTLPVSSRHNRTKKSCGENANVVFVRHESFFAWVGTTADLKNLKF